MTQTLFSTQWYRVKSLTPKLQADCLVHRHCYRGTIWFILEDQTSGRHHRLSKAAYHLVALLDGERSVDEVWEIVNTQFGDQAPSQDEVIRLLGQLHHVNLLQSSAPIDTAELFQRQKHHKTLTLNQSLSNPLSQKIPLWDPDLFLNKHLPKIAWLFHFKVLFCWLLLIVLSGLLLTLHWSAISNQIAVNALSPNNLILVFVLYPLIKGLHELGHAFATKVAGGEVHEMGITLLLFVPIPYVNASAATHFKHKYQRILVSASGILVELFLAGLGLLVWVLVEPGLVRDVALNIFLIGGVSSLFVNGNPLLKYDGYFILADAIDIPNLYQRSTRYLGYLAQRYLFGIKDSESPVHADGEAFWFVCYGIMAFVYRFTVLWFIIVLVTEKYFVIGLILAFWLVLVQLLMPLFKLAHYVFTHPAIRTKGWRVFCANLLLFGLIGAVVFIIPFPSYTNALGVIWLPEHAHIRAGSAGFVEPFSMPSETEIPQGSDVATLSDPFLQTEVDILKAKISELDANYRAEKYKDLVKAQVLKEAIPPVQSELALAENKLNAMQLKTSLSGRLLIPGAEDLPGKFLKQGDLIGFVIDNSKPIVRVAVTQADMGKLRGGTVAVEIRLANHLDQIIPAKIVRETPEATEKLYSDALASNAGGRFILDPKQPDQQIILEKIFPVDVEFNSPETNLYIGTRAYVRFDHGGETLAKQWSRSVRQLLLRQFNV